MRLCLLLCEPFLALAFYPQAAHLAATPRASRRGAVIESSSNAEVIHRGQLMQVFAYRRQQLPVYTEPGDPYGEPASFLRHGEVIRCDDIVDFAGQV